MVSPMTAPLRAAPLDVVQLVAELGLSPHPEGGFYKETFRAVSGASSLIYYLLGRGEFSAFHRVLDRDEAWHHYAGGTLRLHIVHVDGRYEEIRLGSDVSRGETLHAVVPANAWQAAETLDHPVLVGCTVAPAFEFSAFEMPERAVVRRAIGASVPAELVERLTR